jgi:hypothetical protein
LLLFGQEKLDTVFLRTKGLTAELTRGETATRNFGLGKYVFKKIAVSPSRPMNKNNPLPPAVVLPGSEANRQTD